METKLNINTMTANELSFILEAYRLNRVTKSVANQVKEWVKEGHISL